jgi:hypothetical protein
MCSHEPGCAVLCYRIAREILVLLLLLAHHLLYILRFSTGWEVCLPALLFISRNMSQKMKLGGD